MWDRVVFTDEKRFNLIGNDAYESIWVEGKISRAGGADGLEGAREMLDGDGDGAICSGEGVVVGG